MAEFNPEPRDKVKIGGITYEVQPHPAVQTFAFGQEGRKAFVYQIRDTRNSALYALKIFKLAYRLPELVDICRDLASYSQWPGLEVCDRVCLHNGPHDDVIKAYPAMEYAVLMPWVMGSTWYDMIINETPLKRAEAVAFAAATAEVLAGLEESGLSHCDISAANVIINNINGERVHLIDVEDLYAPTFNSPAALPAGTDGYAHKTVASGQWGPYADRFAGAILICEMAAWHHADIRKKSQEEHYFGGTEMHQDVPRYQLMRSTLHDLAPRLAELFDQAWFSDTLDQCPRLAEWHEVLSELNRQARLEKVVGGWQPLVLPGGGLPDAAPRPFTEPDGPRKPPATPAGSPAPAPARKAAPLPTQPPALAVQPSPLPPQAPAQRTPSGAPIEPGDESPVKEWRPLNISSPSAPSVERRPIDLPQAPSQGPSIPISPEPQEESPVQEVSFEALPAAPQPAPTEYQELGEAPSEEVNLPGFEAIEIPATPEGVDFLPLTPIEAASYDPGFEPLAAAHATEQETQAPEPAPQPPTRTSRRRKAISLDEEDGSPDFGAAPPAAIEMAHGLIKPQLGLAQVEMNRPRLVWTESSGAQSYLLQESKSADFTKANEHRTEAGVTTWQPNLPRIGSKMLYYRVCAEADGEQSPWSETLEVQL